MTEINEQPPNCIAAFVVVLNSDGTSSALPLESLPELGLRPAYAVTMRHVERCCADLQVEVSRGIAVNSFSDAVKAFFPTPTPSPADAVAEALRRRFEFEESA